MRRNWSRWRRRECCQVVVGVAVGMSDEPSTVHPTVFIRVMLVWLCVVMGWRVSRVLRLEGLLLLLFMLGELVSRNLAVVVWRVGMMNM